MSGVSLKILSYYSFMTLAVTLSLIVSDVVTEEMKRGPRNTCVLPAYPKNGYYVSSIEDGNPGDEANHFVLNVTCMPGYSLIGDRRFICLTGWTSGFMPECLPYCNADNTNRVVTCEEDALRCVLDRSADVRGVSTPGDEYDCGTFGVAYTHIIAGGHRAEPLELPWHAGVYRKTTNPYMQICGGSIISSNVVLSAAHCFWSDIEKLLPATSFAVAVGKLYRPWNNDRDVHAQKSDIHDIKIPERYQGGATNFQDDIAILIVTTSFTFNDHVTPVCLSFDHQLDEKQLKDDNYGKVGGWGLTGEDDKASQVLQAVDLPYVDIQKCIADSPPGFKAYITSDKICAGYTNGTAVCKGDSGGGLVFPEKVGDKTRHFLRGIVSTAPNSDHACNVFTWGTFTHVVNHERFIRKTLRTGVTAVAAPAVVDTILSPRNYFYTANLMNHATRKPVDQWA